MGNNYVAFGFKDAPPEVSSTPFSEFIRSASSEEKKKIYSKVLKYSEYFGRSSRP
jgi:hypothetical protein